TANTLTWAWYLLWACPTYRRKLHEELDSVLGGRPPTADDVGKLTFTRAVIEETLRLYPPVPLLSRQARGPDRIGNSDVKAGDIILVVPWLLHRHDKHWDAPNVFRPERFMPGAKRPDRFVYIPFSVGQRVCLGQRFGLTEAVLCLAILAQRFELELEPGRHVDVSCRLTLRPEGGLPMFVRSR
ncbi:MAG: cytochrome P450, partial [Alphaproteobacteria bacterium]|nr:cytochrome P450 [Alphaproteobacteria bacterium]